MSKRLLIAGAFGFASLTALAPTTPVLAQANDKVLVVFGSDPCPSGTICVRKGESERYRIPRDIRDNTPAPNNERWADRAKSVDAINASATGGWTGCWAKDMRDAKAQRQADKDNPQD